MSVFNRLNCGLFVFLLLFFARSGFTLTPHTPEVAREKLLMMLSGEWVSRGVYVAAKLEIADLLADGPKSCNDLAQLTKANPESLKRLLHMLAGFGIFEEVDSGIFANSEVSMMLMKASQDSLHALTLFYGEDIHRSWDELLPSICSNTPAFQLAFKQPVFSYFKEHPARAALFQQAMKEKSQAVVKSALTTCNFGRFNAFYDIGGGQGQFIHALLKVYPQTEAVLFELPEVIASIKNRQGGSNRCKLVEGDFFVSVPSGGDAYLLKSVLHDWEDDKCELILKNCHKAMGPESRLFIVEIVLQPKDRSVYANCMDLLMLTVTGGKERTLDSFKEMLDRSGFVLEKIYPTSTEFSVLETRKKE